MPLIVRDATPADVPAVALLYTTCNDFVEQSLLSCLRQDYRNFSLYILDDSSDPESPSWSDTLREM